MLLQIIVTAGLAIAGIVFVLNKWGWLDTYAVHYRQKWMPPADCYFCLSFWLSVLPVGLYLEMSIGERFAIVSVPTISDVWVMFLTVVCSLATATLSAFILSVIIQPKEV